MMEEKLDDKVTRKEFLERVARTSGCKSCDVLAVYKAMVREIEQVMVEDKRLVLTGFGNFYVNQHKGHPTQFGNSSDYVSDYPVAKFSASNVLNHRIRKRMCND